jgi:creatinine amidohydrolase/Fe(II)-dependent formamide hydrolase-like protein
VTDADLCRERGWGVGTRLVGHEGYGATVIVITAIGEELILARPVSHSDRPVDGDEGVWTLRFRDWHVASVPTNGGAGDAAPATATEGHQGGRHAGS